MHIVSSNWVDEQEKQLSGKYDYRLTIFNLPFVPTMCELPNAGSVFNQELMSLKCSTDSQDQFNFYFVDAIHNLDFSKCQASGNLRDIYLELYNALGVKIGYGTILELISNSMVINGVRRIAISKDVNSSTTYPVLKYLSFGQRTILGNNEIEKISYKAHCDILNKDLPYHKVFFSTLEATFPIDKIVVGYFEVGLDSEYIPIGCGFYYMDKNDFANDGFRQQFTFIDIISTLTRKNRVNVIQPLPLQSLRQYLQATVWHNYTSYDVYTIPNVYTLNVPNTLYELSPSGVKNVAYNKTIAETLQMIAQSSGLTLYVDETNTIRFADVRNISSISDTNDMWLLEKPVVVEEEKVKTLTINSFNMKIDYNGVGEGGITTPVEIGSFTSVAGQTIYEMDFDGYFSTATIFNYNATILYQTQNYIVIEETTPNTPVVVGAVYTYTMPQVRNSQVYVIKADGTEDVKLNLELSYNPDFDTVEAYYRYFLSRNKTNILQVRHDYKYYVLDRLYSPFANYGRFFIEDISVNDYRGTISGRIEDEVLVPPIIKVYSDKIVVINSNQATVDFYMYDGTSVFQVYYTIGQNDTLTILYANDNDLYNAYQNWIQYGVGGYYANFEEHYREMLDSKKVSIFGGK